jgi:hypothetical protein
MHGGLPVIGMSVLVYGAVGAVVIVRDGLRRCRRVRPNRAPGAGGKRGVRACAAASQ